MSKLDEIADGAFNVFIATLLTCVAVLARLGTGCVLWKVFHG